MAKGLAATHLFTLGGLGVAAIATIAVFFGIGLSLLTARPAQNLRLGSLFAILAPARPAVISTTGAPREPPPTARHAAPPPPAAAQRASAPAPVFPAARATVAVPAPPVSRVASSNLAASIVTVRPGTAPIPLPATKATMPLTAPPSVHNRETAIPSPAAAPLSAAQIAALLSEGDAAFRSGDLGGARLLYQRVLPAGAGRGALGIGASYDPFFLSHFQLWAEHPDPVTAQAWYRRARDLGAAEAEARLDRLKAHPAGDVPPP